ncbi:hypothetical protein V1511DRAFT_511906 [Dipodascopsis uninucleata]
MSSNNENSASNEFGSNRNPKGGYHDPIAVKWQKVLVGKKLTDSSSATDDSYPKSQLPSPYRVVKPGSMLTMDFRPERLNITLNKEGVIEHVRTG